MDKTIKYLYERVAELTGYPTEGTRTTNNPKQYYTTNWLKMDYNPTYGGYRLDIVLTTTGEVDFDGLTRKTKKEMTSYLRGLITGLTFSKK